MIDWDVILQFFVLFRFILIKHTCYLPVALYFWQKFSSSFWLFDLVLHLKKCLNFLIKCTKKKLKKFTINKHFSTSIYCQFTLCYQNKWFLKLLRTLLTPLLPYILVQWFYFYSCFRSLVKSNKKNQKKTKTKNNI